MNVHITVVGNIADVPERRSLPSGETVIRFTLAASVRRQEDGVWKDAHTSWYRVSGYRKLAENALASLQKGQRVIVTGRLRLRRWESNGKQGTDAEIDADAFGHDLKFGTSTFRAGARAHGEGGSAAAEQWHPGPESGAPIAAVSAGEAQQEPVAVAAATTAEWDTRPLGDQPF